MIQISHLFKFYKTKNLFIGKNNTIKAVNGINLEVKPGEILGIIGESGCGKSTLARLMVGLEKPSSGQVLLDGTNINSLWGRKLNSIRKRLQIVFQDPYASLNSRMTVNQILEEPLINHFKLSSREKEKKICKALNDIGLSESIRFSYPYEISGGQRQRVALARAMMLNPEYLILDEPLASLDVSIQAQILNLLVELREKYHLTYIFISHDINAVRYLCDRVVVMYRGKIVEILPSSNLNQSLHPYTRILSKSSISLESYAPSGDFIWDNNLVFNKKSDSIRGCNFAHNCPEVCDDCFNTDPVFIETKKDHKVACINRRIS